VAVTEVQLEEGSIATPFEQRPIGLELSLCQRYYRYISGAPLSSVGSVANASKIYLGSNMRVQPALDVTPTSGTGATYIASNSAVLSQSNVHSIDAVANIKVSAEL
jgi:hypothetical protein